MTQIPGFTDEDGYFSTPEHAALHAIGVQGGFTTPAREARRMVADGGRGGETGREWLLSRGLSLDGDDEPSQDWQRPDSISVVDPVVAARLPDPQTSPLAEPVPAAVALDGTPAESWLAALRHADAQIAQATGIRGRAIEHLQAAMGDATEATVAGRTVITWRSSKPGRTLDRKALEAAYGADVIASFERDKKTARPFKPVEDGA